MLSKCVYWVGGLQVTEYGFIGHTTRIYNFVLDQIELHPEYVEPGVRLVRLPFSIKTFWKCLFRKAELIG